MRVAEIRKRVEEIQNLAESGDLETARWKESLLHRQVLRSISQQSTGFVRAWAHEALKTRELDLPKSL